MSRVSDFKVGDRVCHVGRHENGTVDSVERECVYVRFDKATPRLNDSIGIFDEGWFRSYPNLLVKLASTPPLKSQGT